MAECIKYKYMFEVSNEITKCSECPFADETYRGCNLYSNGCVDRYHYAEFDTGKPEWCKLKELIQNGNGSYDICEPSVKEISKHVMEAILKTFNKRGLMKQKVIFTSDDLESMRIDVHDALYWINKKKPMNYDDCKIRDHLEDIQKVLYKDDDQNEE